MHTKAKYTANHLCRNGLFGLTCLLLLIAAFARAQYLFLNADSIRNAFKQQPKDTATVNRMNDYAAGIMSNEPMVCLQILRDARLLATAIGYAYGSSVSYGLESRLLFYQVKFDSGKLLLDKAYQLIERNTDKRSIIQKATLTHTYANIYHQKQQYDSALTKYLQAIALFNSVKEENKVFFSYYNISGIYNLLGDTTKAMFYARETQRMAAASPDSNYRMRSLIALAEAYAGKKMYDSVFHIANTGLPIATQMNNVFGIGKFYSLLGIYHVQLTHQYDTAIALFKDALDLYSSINIWYDIALIQQLLGNAYLQKGDLPNAIVYLTAADKLAREMKLDQVRLLTLADLVSAHQKQGNIEKGFSLLQQLMLIKDSVDGRNNRKLVQDLETRYQTQKKEALLSSQQSEIQKKNLINYILAGGAFSLIVISLLSYRNYKNKQKLQQKKIMALEQEKQLLAAEAVLQGQEAERVRVSKDLHDGIGSMLSGIKLTFNAIEAPEVKNKEGQTAFLQVSKKIDDTIAELRRVAHSMMPQALLQLGLKAAIADYVAGLQSTGQMQVVYQTYGLEERLPADTEIGVYRMVQELLSNVIKHAHATQVLVQLEKQNNQLHLTVEDDGVGMNIAAANAKGGAGLANLYFRAQCLKATCHIQSSPHKGTSVLVEIPLQ
jgi:two-component system, NarL family, sensor kinase